MKRDIDLTSGSIYEKLFKLALPIMMTSFLQMAYNMMDMLWLGNYDSSGEAVTAAGTAGFFTWFGFAFIVLVKIGAEVKVAHSIGENKPEKTRGYIESALKLIIILGVAYGVLLLIFKQGLIAFFNTGKPELDIMSVDYLKIVALGMVFYFANPVFTAIFNGSGDSVTPLIINSIGLIMNLILDPVLIFGMGGFNEMGIKGAALATIISQATVTLVFVITIFTRKEGRRLFEGVNIFHRFKFDYMKDILKVGYPVAVQSGLFTIISITIGRIISGIDPLGIGVQKVGSQIESLSWMTAGGFQTALGTFIGQNYGAKKWDRICKGYLAAISIVTVFGLLVTAGLTFGAAPIFKLFISDPKPLSMGTTYLKILGLSQVFMCIEITTAGAFNGLGKTQVPSIVSIIFTGLRVPGALVLSSIAIFGIKGVWWSITLSSVFKGVILVILFIRLLDKHPEVGMRNIKKYFKQQFNRQEREVSA